VAKLYKRKLPSGRVVWQLTHGTGKDRVRFTAGHSKEEAEAALRLFERQLAIHGAPPEEEAIERAVATYCRYLETNRSPSTYRRYERVLRTFVECYLPAFQLSVKLLREIKPAHIEDFKERRYSGEIVESEERLEAEAKREKKLREALKEEAEAETPAANARYGWLGRKRLRRKVTKRTVNYELRALSTFFRWAKRRNLLLYDPVENVERFRIPKRALPKFMTAEELAAFFAACDPWERRVFGIFLLSGMRRGELENLEWADVRLDLGVIVIRAKEDWQPKTSERLIPISPALRGILAKEWRERRSDRWVVANREANRERHLLPKLKRICRHAGITPAAATVHALRHSFATHLRMSGVPLENIAELLGHSDLATTKIYAKLETAHLQEAVGRLAFLLPEEMSHENVTRADFEEGEDDKSFDEKSYEDGFPAWLGGRDSNPDSAVQSRMSCR